MDARGPKYTVNGIGFNSLDAIKKHCKAIKERATLGIEPEEGLRFTLDGDDLAFMLDFIECMHPSCDDILGCGLFSIQVGYVGSEVGKPHWSFYAIRIDGSEDLFGYSKCGLNKSRSETKDAFAAKRRAIADQTIAYKEQYFDGQDFAICEATGELMRREDCHVDHKDPTFAQLEEQFFQGWEPDLEQVGKKWEIKDDEGIRTSWQEFHRKHATLRCVTRAFNLSRKDVRHESP